MVLKNNERSSGFLRANLPVAGAIALKLAGAFYSFLIIFIVARVSGATVTGDYAMALATANVASIVALLGLDQIAIRTIGGDLREGRKDLAWAALMAVVRMVLPLAIVLTVVLAILARYAPLFGASPMAILAISISVVGFPLLRMAVVTLRACGSVLWSQFFDGVHSLIILSAVAAVLLISGGRIEATFLAICYSAAICIAAALAWFRLLTETRQWPRTGVSSAPLLSASWPVFVASFCLTFSQWIVLAQLGSGLGLADVGAFRVAVQIITIIALMLTTVESLVSPDLAGDFRQKDIAMAWKRHRQASLVMFAAAAAPILACLVAPAPILSLFGPEFAVASSALIILCVAQIVNILTGPIGGMMVMSGHERLSLALSIASLILVASLSVLLVPTFGLVGAAAAIASGTIMRNVIAYVVMRNRLRP